MLALPSGTTICVIHETVSFGCGIDGMRAHCVSIAKRDPYTSGYFLFLNKSKNQVRVIWYDGTAFFLCTKRLSTGKFQNWPKSGESVFSTIEYFQAQGLLSGSSAHFKNYHPVWKKLDKT
jgi:transposase